MHKQACYSIFGWVSEMSATVSGLVLFSVGLTGLFGYTLSSTSVVIILLEPLGYGPMWDEVYWFSMMITGIMLTTLFRPRFFAMLALLMIGFKLVLVRS